MNKVVEIVIEGEVVDELEYLMMQKKRGRKPKKYSSCNRIIIPKQVMKEPLQPHPPP